MKRAIAFTGTIKESKRITEMFSTVVDEYLYNSSNYSNPFKIDIDHADGSMNAVQKNSKIDWLKNEVPNNTCRVLSNAKFLTEGIDVPDLDAIMFLKPRRSKIDIAQAVGRVMRKSEGKDYGYIILPIGVPAGSEAHSVLDNNEKYQVVWEILNALRSIDERFDATINKLELNKKKPEQIQVIGVGDAPNDLEEAGEREEQLAFELNEEQLSDLERAIYGKIVQKVGNVRYWEQWSKDVAEIARKHIERIYIILEDKNSLVYHKFLEFVNSLKHNINDSIDEEQAIEMLSQHLITKPIFDALFDTYSFIQNNPVSKSMEKMVSLLDEKGLMKEQEKLQEFYESVKDRASNIDNLEAKQKIIIQLYEKFFKTAFKETTDRLGIVFTPVEVVDFILKSVNDVSKLYFDKELSEKNVHMLDPFTGTGTFIVRLLQSGIIKKKI
ncbi:helicase-related protein [Staphylococcus ureilyticus]